jgi:hypothetical protein
MHPKPIAKHIRCSSHERGYALTIVPPNSTIKVYTTIEKIMMNKKYPLLKNPAKTLSSSG